MTTLDDPHRLDLEFGSSGQLILEISPSVSFYFNLVSFNGSNMMMWVSFKGSKKDDQKYKFTIEVLDKQGRASLSCTRLCVPCDISREEVKEKFLGVVINKDMTHEISTGRFTNVPMIVALVQFFLNL